MKQGSVMPRATDWGISTAWNARKPEERAPKPRSHLWATELWRPAVDNLLTLRGVIPSNPPNERSQFKFDAGHLMEWVVGLVFQRAGIYKEAERWVSFQYPGLLEVTGRIDFVAGGMPDYDLALKLLKPENRTALVLEELRPFSLPDETLERVAYIIQSGEVVLPDFFVKDAKRVIEYLRDNFPEGLEELFFEVKSAASRIADGMEKNLVAKPGHVLQIYHYLKAENQPRGKIAYICRDDLRLFEVPVLNPSLVEDEYRAVIEKNTRYYRAHERTPIEKFLIAPDSSDDPRWLYNPEGLEDLPPLEPTIVFEDGKFSKNFGVEWSNYLTMLYGFESPRAYSDSVKGKVGRWNRVMKRIKDGATMTKLNLDAIEEMGKEGWDAKKLAESFSDDNVEEDSE